MNSAMNHGKQDFLLLLTLRYNFLFGTVAQLVEEEGVEEGWKGWKGYLSLVWM